MSLIAGGGGVIRRRVMATGVAEAGPARSIGASADDATVTVAPGDTVDITITLARTNYAGTVVPSVAGLPAGVTGTFSDMSLKGAEVTTVLTLTADVEASADADAFVVTLAGADVEPVTVNGTVAVEAPGTTLVFSADRAGGYVEVYAPGDDPDTDVPQEVVALDGSGDGETEELEAGTYTCRYHPPDDYSIGVGEPDTKTGEPGDTLSFTSQQSSVFEDFTSYADDADFQAKYLTQENVERTEDMDGTLDALGRVTLTTEGPGGKKVASYDLSDVSALVNSVRMMMTWLTNPQTYQDEIWVSHIVKLGSTHATGRFMPETAYKFALLDFFRQLLGGGGGGPSRVGWYLVGHDTPVIYGDGPELTPVTIDLAAVHPDGYDVMRDWRRWVFGYLGLKTANKRMVAFCDGYLMAEMVNTTTWELAGVSAPISLELGSTWNMTPTPTHISGTAQGGTSNTVTLPAGASAVDGYYVGLIAELISGPGAKSRIGGHSDTINQATSGGPTSITTEANAIVGNAGSFVTLGVQVDDIVYLSGHPAVSSATPLHVTAVTATRIEFTETITVNGTPDTAFSLAVYSNASAGGTQGEAGLITAYNGTTKEATIVCANEDGSPSSTWLNGTPDGTTVMAVIGTTKLPSVRLNSEVSVHFTRPSLLLPAGYA